MKYFNSVIEAIRQAAEDFGEGAYKQVSFAVPLDQIALFENFIKINGKDKLLELILCRLREVK